MKNLLAKLKSMVDELQATTSTNDKIVILGKYLNVEGAEDLKKLIFYTFNPFYQFYVTSDVLKKLAHLKEAPNTGNIFDLLDALRTRKWTGHEAVSAVNNFVFMNPEFTELIHNIVDKDLKCRIGDTTINKVVKGLIPVFDVALGEKYEAGDVDFENEKWLVSHKLDGNRLLLVIDENGIAVPLSREGKVFETLDKIVQDIKQANLKSVVIDGEICVIDKDGREDFPGIMKEIRRKAHTIQNPKYKTFDMLTLDEFNSRTSTRTLSERQIDLKAMIDANTELKHIDMLEQEPVLNETVFQRWMDESIKNGWEGLILRKDTIYKGKRSKDVLKVKQFQDAEYIVESMASGPFRIVSEGKEAEEIVMSNVVIKHKGFDVSVGSGFTLDQRRQFHKCPKDIVGKTIRVSYFEETKNQNGGVSLRFPTLVHVYEHGRQD